MERDWIPSEGEDLNRVGSDEDLSERQAAAGGFEGEFDEREGPDVFEGEFGERSAAAGERPETPEQPSQDVPRER